MKTFRLLSVLACIIFVPMLTFRSNAKRVDNPVIQASNTSTIDVTGVTADGDATVLDIHARYIPHYWIRIVSDSYLEADGRKYKMTKAEGITPDENFWMPDSGEADFRLFFEPVPDSVSKVDFIEGNDPRAFRIWGIDLTGEADPLAINPGVPAGLLDDMPSFDMSSQIFKVAPTRLNVHLAGFKPDMETKYSVYVNSLTGQKEMQSLQLDENGDGILDVTLYGTSYMMFVDNDRIAGYSLMLAPGENLDVYLDGNMSGRMAMARRKVNHDNSERFFSMPNVYHSGIYRPYERAMVKAQKETPVLDIMNCFSLEDNPDIRYDMPTSEYIDRMLSIYSSKQEMIDALGQSDDVKAILSNMLAASLLSKIGRTDYSMKNLYWEETGSDYGSPVPDGAVTVKVGPEEWKKVAESVKVTEDPRLLPIMLKFSMTDDFLGKDNSLGDVLPDGSMLSEINKYCKLMKKLDAGSFIESDMEMARGMGDSFYADALEARQEEIEAMKDKYRSVDVQKTPDVADNEVFDAIVAPYKGNLVIVDLWNTWCGPCRAAIAETEPLKETELKKDGIVWIYIANETSPEDKYLEMVSGIKGVHYRLNPGQWKAICERFNVDGIPFYILVDREGNAEARPDMRIHEIYKKTILEN